MIVLGIALSDGGFAYGTIGDLVVLMMMMMMMMTTLKMKDND